LIYILNTSTEFFGRLASTHDWILVLSKLRNAYGTPPPAMITLVSPIVVMPLPMTVTLHDAPIVVVILVLAMLLPMTVILCDAPIVLVMPAPNTILVLAMLLPMTVTLHDAPIVVVILVLAMLVPNTVTTCDSPIVSEIVDAPTDSSSATLFVRVMLAV
jgi:hypothetical protein